MIKIKKCEVHIEGEFSDVATEFTFGLRDLISIAENDGIDISEVLGGLIAGIYRIYRIKDKEGFLECLKLGKFIDYKCKEIKRG